MGYIYIDAETEDYLLYEERIVGNREAIAQIERDYHGAELD
jgi:hypothetical protein